MTRIQSRAQSAPLKGWRFDPSRDANQLTHAVLPGRTIAACGVQLTVFGEPWPDPRAPVPMTRCSICAKAVTLAWSADEAPFG